MLSVSFRKFLPTRYSALFTAVTGRGHMRSITTLSAAFKVCTHVCLRRNFPDSAPVGDFTRSLVNDPPKYIWTRELKVCSAQPRSMNQYLTES